MEQRYNEVQGLKKFDPRLSFQPQPKNKENVFQTPVASVKESRKSTGSPLARVNRTWSELLIPTNLTFILMFKCNIDVVKIYCSYLTYKRVQMKWNKYFTYT